MILYYSLAANPCVARPDRVTFGVPRVHSYEPDRLTLELNSKNPEGVQPLGEPRGCEDIEMSVLKASTSPTSSLTHNRGCKRSWHQVQGVLKPHLSYQVV
ncbi:hypothetical protein RRG08_042376 [Elysia crispata]|uniref:Uncharacterized protein n=1 Tax=Elysia crispata TaxID=231223 RepID=A0AAE0ZCX8_9GAST|nr:hypothetical protein RRG08_042376 [Elysia crispata]